MLSLTSLETERTWGGGEKDTIIDIHVGKMTLKCA